MRDTLLYTGLEDVRVSTNVRAHRLTLQRSLPPPLLRETNAEAEQEGELPPNWQRIVDGDKVYYHNTATHQSVWEKPAVIPPPPPAPAEEDTVYGCCSLHILDNCGTKSKDAVTLMTKLARAGDETTQQHYLNLMRQTCGDDIVDKVVVRMPRFTSVAYMELDLESNYGWVTSNPVEQTFSSDQLLRGLPPARAVLHVVEEMANKISTCKLEAERDLKKGWKVVPSEVEAIKTLARDARSKWDVNLVSIEQDGGEQLKFTVSNRTRSAVFPVILRPGTYSGPLEHWE